MTTTNQSNVFYANSRYAVVDDGCPGLKIYDRVLKQVNLARFGAFYDNMGSPYPVSGLEAAIDAANAAEKEDTQ